jgi:hypothetical protein
MEIRPVATLPKAVEARMEKRQSESLTDEDQDEEWAGTISIGTPAQSFLIDFDSKSSTTSFSTSAAHSSFSWFLRPLGSFLLLHQQHLQVQAHLQGHLFFYLLEEVWYLLYPVR